LVFHLSKHTHTHTHKHILSMASAVGKYAANKFLKKQMKTYANKNVESDQDPYFAMVEDPRKPGKLKKVKKTIPAYIPEHDAMVLATVRKRAYRLDCCLFSFLGIRFGWEAVIGLIPLVGDAVGVLFALMLVRKAMSIDGGLDATLKFRMLINIALDFAIGLVPFLGDIADAAFKCNTKNLRLLEVALDKKYKPDHAARSDERDSRKLTKEEKDRRASKRKSGIFPRADPPPATVFEDFSDDEDEGDRRGYGESMGEVRRPAPARAPASRHERR